MKNNIILFVCFIFLFFNAEASKNEKKNKVKSMTQYATLTDKGKTSTYKESYEEYDRNGKLTLKIDYKPDGTIDSKLVIKYNSSNDKSEETEYDAKGMMRKKTTWSYNAQGEKDTETDFDTAGKVKKKSRFAYNAKNLKTEKRTFNGNNVLESVKKYEYVYY
jgi:flagellar basal body L-ring protein FlgH